MEVTFTILSDCEALDCKTRTAPVDTGPIVIQETPGNESTAVRYRPCIYLVNRRYHYFLIQENISDEEAFASFTEAVNRKMIRKKTPKISRVYRTVDNDES